MSQSLPHKLVIFDWDGTLMDSHAKIVHSMQRASEEVGVEVLSRQTIRDIIGLGLPEAITRLYPVITPAQHAAMSEQYRHFFVHDNSVSMTLFDQAEALISRLESQDRLIAVATGKTRAGLDRILDELGMTHRFHATRCADETASKPHPKMVLEILDELKTSADEAIMVGDTEYDLAMGQSAGVQGVGVTYGSHTRDQLQRHSPLVIVDSVEQLLEQF